MTGDGIVVADVRISLSMAKISHCTDEDTTLLCLTTIPVRKTKVL